MGILVDNKYSHGETVYLKTDKEQMPRLIYCIKVFKNDILYEVVCGTITSAHYDFELSHEQNLVFSTTGNL